eukprot:s102_g20.t1
MLLPLNLEEERTGTDRSQDGKNMARLGLVLDKVAVIEGSVRVHGPLDVTDHPDTDQTLLYCSPEERNVKAQMESFLLQSVKKFAKNERIFEFDLERVQKRLNLHSKDADGVLNYAGHEDSGKAAQRWFKQTEALAMAALKDHESGQHKIFAGFAQTLADTTSRMSKDHMGTTGFSMSDTHVSFPEGAAATAAPQGSILLQPEERDMLQSLEMQKKQKEKAVWELKRQLDELIDKRRKMDEAIVPQSSTSERPRSGERRLQHAKSVKEMDQALESLDEERLSARRSMENAGPQMAKMVDFMTTGQRNLRNLLEDLKRAEQKQAEVHEKLEELVRPEAKTLVHDMVRNKEMAVELLDASILPIAGSSSSIRMADRDENMSQLIADSKTVSNQQLVAVARKRQQLRQEKEAKEIELEERRAAAVAAKAEKDAQNGIVALDEAEASLGIDTSLVKDVKGMCLRGNMLLSDLRHEQKDNHVEEVPPHVAHVMEEMKEAIAKTSKVLAGKLELDNVPSLTGEFEDVEITVINLKMTGQSRGTDRRGALLKRSVRHVEDVVEEAEELPGSGEKNVSAEKLRQLKEEVETNRAALAQLERRVQRMRVALKQAESEAQSRGRVSTMSSMSQLTQSSWPAEQHSASAATEEDDNLSVGSEFDSDAEDLACASTLMLPRKSSMQNAGSGVAKKESLAENGRGSTALTRQASHQALGGRPRPEPIVTPSLSQAETVERKKSLRALKHAKLVYEGLQEDLAALRSDVEELRKAKGLPSGAAAQDEYSDAYKQSQADQEGDDEMDSTVDQLSQDATEGSQKALAKVGSEQSGEDEAMKINDIGKTDKAKCKDGCRLGDGAGFAIGPPPEDEGPGFSGANGSGSEGVAFPGGQGEGGAGSSAAGFGGANGANGGNGGSGGGGGSGGNGGLGGGGGEAQVPQEWLDADAAKEADDRAVELVAKEAERSHRRFEDVANMDTDDAANDQYALLPRPIYTMDTKFEDSEGNLEAQGWPPKGATDKWGGPPVQLPVNLASGTMVSRIDWTSFLLAFLAPSCPRPRWTLPSHCCVQQAATSFETPGPKSADDDGDDLDDTPDDIQTIYEQEPPPPGARDKFGGPAMQQPDDMEGPSAEGNCRSLLMASMCPTLPRRRKRDIDFL